MAVMWKPILDWDDEGWRDQAACRHSDPDLFFPAGSTGLAVDHIHAAKAVCRSCPVQQPYLQFALETNQEAESGAAWTRRSAASCAGCGQSPQAADEVRDRVRVDVAPMERVSAVAWIDWDHGVRWGTSK